MLEEKPHTKDVEDFRKEAVYYSKQGKRFRFLLETVVGCFGNCPGCAFTRDERLTFRNPIIPSDKFPELFDKMLQIIEFRHGMNGFAMGGEIETTVINYGAGEHFIYDDDYLGKLFEQTSIFFEKVPTKRNVLAFSSSGLMSPEKMHKHSRTMLQHLKKEQFVVDFVIDLSRFDKLQNNYKKSFDFFIENFGFVDLAINIEKDSDTRDWDAFCKFVDERGILNVDLVYALNGSNKERVTIEPKKFFEIYEKIVTNTKNGKHLFDINGFLRIKDNEEDYLERLNDLDFHTLSKNTVSTLMSDAMFIDSDFQASPVMFGIFADIPLNRRFNWSPAGSIFDENFVELWKNYEKKMLQKLIKINSSNPHCGSCEFEKQCYSSGLPYLNELINHKNVTSAEQCRNPIRPFLEAKKNNYLIHKENEF